MKSTNLKFISGRKIKKMKNNKETIWELYDDQNRKRGWFGIRNVQLNKTEVHKHGT